MPLPGQYFCSSCMKPIKSPGKCTSCEAREMRAMKMGNRCDHCNTPGTKSLLYVNRKTKKTYCVDCRAEFRSQLVAKGFEIETANKIMVEDFVLLNDPMSKKNIRKRK